MSQRLLTSVFLAFLTVYLLNSYVFKRQVQAPLEGLKAGQVYQLPSAKDLARPADRTIAYTAQRYDEQTLEIGNELFSATVSSHGGAVSALGYNEHKDAKGNPISTLHQSDDAQHEQKLFVVATQGEAPLEYDIEKSDDNLTAKATARAGDWHISKVFALQKDSYKVNLSVTFTPRSRSAEPLRPRLICPLPFQSEIVRDKVVGAVENAKGNGFDTVSGSKFVEQAWVAPQMFGGASTYFASMMISDDQNFAQRGYYKDYNGRHVSAILEGPELTSEKTYNFSFYIGPKKLSYLKKADARLEKMLVWGVLSYVTRFMRMMINMFHDFTDNYGLAIILLALLIRLLLLPFTISASRHMEEQKKLAPQISYIRKKFRSDPQAMHNEMMSLYRRHNASPFGMFFSVGMLIPQFLFMYLFNSILYSTVEFHNAPFFGWITDLTSKDPYYLLPVLFTLLMFAQPMGNDGSKRTLASWLVPCVIGAFLSGASAGIMLYIVAGLIFALLETRLKAIFSASK